MPSFLDDFRKRLEQSVAPITNRLREQFGIGAQPPAKTPLSPALSTPPAPVQKPPVVSQTPEADKLRSRFLDPYAQEAERKIQEAKNSQSPFMKFLQKSSAEAVDRGARAVDDFFGDQTKNVSDFVSGKLRLTKDDILDGLKKTGAGTMKLTGSLAQGINEGIFRIGTSIADEVLPGYKEQRLAIPADDMSSQFLKSLTGREQITGYREMFNGVGKWAEDNGATENAAHTFAGFAVLGSIFMDNPVGGAGKAGMTLTKEGIEAVAKEVDEAAIRTIIKNENPALSDKAADFITPMFREASTPEEVQNIVRYVNGAKRTAEKAASRKELVSGAKAAKLSEDAVDDFVKAREIDPNAVLKIEGKAIDQASLPPELRRAAKNVVEGETGNPAVLVDLPVSKIAPSPDAPFETLSQDTFTAGRKIKDPVQVQYNPETKTYRLTDGANRTTQAIANGDETIPAVVEIVDDQGAPAARLIDADQAGPTLPARLDRTAPADPNLVRALGSAKDPYEVLNIMKNAFPNLPDAVVNRFVNRFVRTKRISNVENLIVAARNLDQTMKGGSIRTAGKEAKKLGTDDLPKSAGKILAETTSPAVRKVMRQDQKMSMIRTLKDKFEDPKAAVAAQHEYDRIWDDLNQGIVDEFEQISLQKSFMEDVLDDNPAAGLFKKYYKKGEIDQSLEDIMRGAERQRKARVNHKRQKGKKKPDPLTKRQENALNLEEEIKEAGLKDFDEAQAAIERYADARGEIESLTSRIKELKPRVQEAQILQEGLDDIAVIPQKEVEAMDRLITTRNFQDYFNDISGFAGQARDLTRNFEKFFGEKYQEIKKALLDPFDDAKAARVDEVKKIGDDIDKDVISKYGIQRGSKESAAIQRYGDTDLPAGERMSYDDLVKEFGREKADNIVAADAWFRKEYDRLIDELNAVRKKIYPRNPSKLIAKRKNYYRHFQEMTDTWGDALREFLETPSGITPNLVGTSEFTKPKSRWLPFAQAREGQSTTLDAVGGFLEYADLYSYAKHIDPQVSKFRYLQRKISEVAPRAGEEVKMPDGKKFKAKGAEGFLGFLDDFSRDLTGNTNPADRFIQKIVGRKNIRAARFINNRLKANSIGGNLGSALAQIANVPAGVADTKLYAIPGMKRTIASTIMHNEPMSKSLFLKERYQELLKERFPSSFMNKPLRRTGEEARKRAGWIMQKADEIGTKFIWNSEYEKALGLIKKGKDIDPVRYADDKTRKIVAGRGVGEIPLGQKSLVAQFTIPFTLEVGNAWWIMKDWMKEKDFAAFTTFFLANYMLNEIAENTRGSRITFDPINALIQGAQSLAEEYKEGNYARGNLKFLGRQAGEVFSNIPGGQQAAALLQGSSAQKGLDALGVPFKTKELFGDSVAGRFGTPLIANIFDLKDTLYRLLPPVGGKQIQKTVDGITALLEGNAEDSKGSKTFDVPRSPQNVVRALMFGSGATSEARGYFDERSDLFERINRQDAMNTVAAAEAEADYAEIKKLSASGQGQAAAARLGEIAKEDKNKALKIVEIMKADAQGLTGNDRLIKMLNVKNGERAKYIAEQLKKIKSPADRKAYLADLAKKKLLTADTIKQMAILQAK